MKALGVDGKLVADQLGHSLDVNQNVYTQIARRKPVGDCEPAREKPAGDVNGAQGEAGICKLLISWSGRRGSNPRRPAWEAGILPLNYSRRLQLNDFR
jgi:hypothetical protein